MKYLVVVLFLLVSCQKVDSEKIDVNIEAVPIPWSVKVSSMNAWGIPFISKDIPERSAALGKALKNRNIDFAFIQEAWSDSVQNALAEGSSFENREYYKLSGLMFLGYSPFVRSKFHRFTLLGSLLDITEGDAWSEKGVGMVTTFHQGSSISMFNTHLIARYGDDETLEDKSTLDRMTELFEVFASIVEDSDSELFVIAGDFNMRPMNAEYGFWKELTGLDGVLLEEKDPFLCTYCSDNSYVENNHGQLDYIWVSPKLRIARGVIDYTEQISVGEKRVNLSDHYGLTAEIRAEKIRKDTGILRHLMLKRLYELDERLDKELGKIFPQGFVDQLCRVCNLRTASKNVNRYIEAVEGVSTDRVLVARIENYFKLFDN